MGALQPPSSCVPKQKHTGRGRVVLCESHQRASLTYRYDSLRVRTHVRTWKMRGKATERQGEGGTCHVLTCRRLQPWPAGGKASPWGFSRSVNCTLAPRALLGPTHSALLSPPQSSEHPVPDAAPEVMVAAVSHTVSQENGIRPGWGTCTQVCQPWFPSPGSSANTWTLPSSLHLGLPQRDQAVEASREKKGVPTRPGSPLHKPGSGPLCQQLLATLRSLGAGAAPPIRP